MRDSHLLLVKFVTVTYYEKQVTVPNYVNCELRIEAFEKRSSTGVSPVFSDQKTMGETPMLQFFKGINYESTFIVGKRRRLKRQSATTQATAKLLSRIGIISLRERRKKKRRMQNRVVSRRGRRSRSASSRIVDAKTTTQD